MANTMRSKKTPAAETERRQDSSTVRKRKKYENAQQMSVPGKAIIAASAMLSVAVLGASVASAYFRCDTDLSIFRELQTIDQSPHLRAQVPGSRTFVSYTSSSWETLWLANIDAWTRDKMICDKMLNKENIAWLHDFLNYTCTAWYEPPYNNWCLFDDGSEHKIWYNSADREALTLLWDDSWLPSDARVNPSKPVVPISDLARVFSHFVFRDEATGQEYTEYIEPLVSHLRHPVSGCLTNANDERFTFTRSHIIPPPPSTNAKYPKSYYFDVGLPSWEPDASYFQALWPRHGISFDDFYVFESSAASPQEFYGGVPLYDRIRVHLSDKALSIDGGNDDTISLSAFIKEKANKGDYVLLKLDTKNPSLEDAIIDQIMQDSDSIINELFWENRVSWNYLMEKSWGTGEGLRELTPRNTYDRFLGLRQKGIRAHSWI